MVLVHDDDLARIHEVCDSDVSRRFIPPVCFLAYPWLQARDSLKSHAVIHFLRKSQPKIQQVQYGEFLPALWLL
jgi:hypothetical protein